MTDRLRAGATTPRRVTIDERAAGLAPGCLPGKGIAWVRPVRT